MSNSNVSGAGYTQYTSSNNTVTKNTTTGSNTLDKNAFLKILMAEVSNQDPTSQDNDPTQYVSQLAQFTSLEQMTNLNDTMTFSSAASLMGGTVTLSDEDDNGNHITGVVKSVSKSGDDSILSIQVPGSSTLQNYDFSDVIAVTPTGTSSVADGTAASSSSSSNK